MTSKPGPGLGTDQYPEPKEEVYPKPPLVSPHTERTELGELLTQMQLVNKHLHAITTQLEAIATHLTASQNPKSGLEKPIEHF